MTGVLEVERVGPLVSVQDAGRPGSMRFGVPRGGPMDRLVHASANVAVGNAASASALEVSRGGVALRCDGEGVVVGVTGDGFRLEVDGHRRAGWQVVRLRPGQLLEVVADRPKVHQPGSWATIAVAGGIDAPTWLGSTSTHVATGLGGGVLTAGARLRVSGSHDAGERLGPIPRPQGSSSGPRSPGLDDTGLDDTGSHDTGSDGTGMHGTVLRVVIGPQHARFDDRAVDALLDATWTTTDATDRMGTRLDGPSLELRDALSIPSSPIVRGSVQVAGDGVPTLLHADHQTTGGYPRIATVVDADLDRAAQLPPASPLRFVAVSPAEAVTSARDDAARRTAHLERVTGPTRTLAHRLRSTNLVAGVVDGRDLTG